MNAEATTQLATRTGHYGLLDGRGQVPLRHAVRITLGWSLASRTALYHSLTWGVCVGVFNSLQSPPQTWPMMLGGSMLVALVIGYMAPIPWRWRLVRGCSPWRLLANAAVAMACGYVLFFGSFFLMGLASYGAGMFRAEAITRMALVGFGGFFFVIMGAYITTDQDSARLQHKLARESRRQEELAERAREIALRSQINPHFFFNALNTIAALIPTRPADAERAVELLAESLRPALTRGQPLVGTLRSELEVARAYADLELLRHGERLAITWDIDDAALEAPLPTLSLQPLIENAIRHGLTPTPGRHRIDIHARRGSALELIVANRPEGDAPIDYPREAPAPPGHALHNVRHRLVARFGRGASLAVRLSDDGRAARARMVVPSHEVRP